MDGPIIIKFGGVILYKIAKNMYQHLRQYFFAIFVIKSGEIEIFF